MQADVIMGLDGSNGGSWSTTFSTESFVKLHHYNNARNGENEIVIVSKMYHSHRILMGDFLLPVVLVMPLGQVID